MSNEGSKRERKLAKQVRYAEWERLQKQANRREEILLQKIVELQDKIDTIKEI